MELSSASGVGVIDKAVAILDACIHGATFTQLCDTLGTSRATTHRLASALEHHGLLSRDTEGRWHPGPHLSTLAGAAPETLADAAVPILTQLRDDTGESAQLFSRSGQTRVCVASVERTHGLRDTIPLGSVLPMTAGSAAQVLLAWEAPAVAKILLSQARFSGRTLAVVRSRGWATSVGEREEGVGSVSAPVRNAAGDVIAAVSVSGPIHRLTHSPGPRYSVAVLDAAHALHEWHSH